MSHPPGRLITFEGGEGAGKSTQLCRLAGKLRAAGLSVLTSREPGGTTGAEAIRELLVTGDEDRWSPITEALLHTAARADHVARLIRPHLAQGAWVLLDRFVDSTRVYQGIAGEVGVERIDRLQKLAFGDLEPDLTLVLDLPVEVGLERAARVTANGRYERMGAPFHERVRRGFLALAAAQPERIVVIDASGTEEEVGTRVAGAIGARLGLAVASLRN
jgi:dTMP kinase